MAERAIRIVDENPHGGFSSMIQRRRPMALRSLVLAATLVAPQVALAQEIVGRGAIKGQVVQLLDDGTWRYAPKGGDVSDDCKPVDLGVDFCAGSLGWKRLTPPQGGQVAALYEIDARNYAQFVVEDLGTDDGLTPEFMRQAVLGNAKMGAGSKPVVVEVLPATMAGLSGETVIFLANMNGLDLVFANSVFIEPKRTMQIMTFAAAREYKPEQAELQAALLANTKITQ